MRDEARAIADHLHAAHQEGHVRGGMVDDPSMDASAAALFSKSVSMLVRKKYGDFARTTAG